MRLFVMIVLITVIVLCNFGVKWGRREYASRCYPVEHGCAVRRQESKYYDWKDGVGRSTRSIS